MRLRYKSGLQNVVGVYCNDEGKQRGGGLACLWDDSIEVKLVSKLTNHIDMEVLNQNEKKGGNLVVLSQAESFIEAIQSNSLLDLGFDGHPFTWSNGKSGDRNIQERLDRALANVEWKELFSMTTVHHLEMFKSDHSLILIDSQGEKRKRKRGDYHFKLEEICLLNKECYKVVEQSWRNSTETLKEKLGQCERRLDKWGEENFGNIPKMIREEQKELAHSNSIQQIEEVLRNTREVEAKLNELLKLEEIWWSQRSRANWLRHCDRSTKYFHQKAS
ncbi:uncharacterized protein [Arachis hypogaea]|uniref:uncharacterized protein n=1 Tax=Arachis hypogaea TaxID=3818 RepID=UPI003B21317D